MTDYGLTVLLAEAKVHARLGPSDPGCDLIIRRLVAALEPRVVTTEAELDALPERTVVLDDDGGVWRKSTKFPSEWVDLDYSASREELITSDAHTVLWQNSDGPRAFVVHVPAATGQARG